MVVKANPEFGVELALVVPYAYHLHTQGKLDTVITSKGMKPNERRGIRHNKLK